MDSCISTINFKILFSANVAAGISLSACAFALFRLEYPTLSLLSCISLASGERFRGSIPPVFFRLFGGEATCVAPSASLAVKQLSHRNMGRHVLCSHTIVSNGSVPLDVLQQTQQQKVLSSTKSDSSSTFETADRIEELSMISHPTCRWAVLQGGGFPVHLGGAEIRLC